MRVRAARVCAKACRRAAAHGRSAVVILKAAKHKQETTLTVPKQMHRRTTIFAPTRQHNHRPVLSRAGRSSCCQPPPSSPQHPQRPSTSPAATTLWSRKKRPRPGRGCPRRPARTRRLGQGWQRDQRDSEAVAALVPPVLGRNKKGGALITGRMRDQANRTRAACQLVGALSVHRRARPFSTGT